MLVLNPFCETGTEGTLWFLHDTSCIGYNGLRGIANGAHLRIYDHENEIIFDDIIRQDTETGWEPYPYYLTHKYEGKLHTREELKEMGLGQPVALGLWVHWTQKGWAPDAWATLFFEEPPLRAEIMTDEDYRG